MQLKVFVKNECYEFYFAMKLFEDDKVFVGNVEIFLL